MIENDLQKQMSKISQDLKRSYCQEFMIEKKNILDFVFENLTINSVAELGCVWGVNCAYGLYIHDTYHPESIKMIDTHWNKESIEICKSKKEIQIFEQNFGDISMAREIGKVDLIILFDVLLHQVAPDWDRILQIYSPFTNHFAIFNPQYIRSPISVRLLNLGEKEYFKNVPHESSHPTYKALFTNMWEQHPTHQRIWRDVHHVWQWGITDHDLLDKMERLGFNLFYYKNHGKLLENFENHAFIFKKGSYDC